MARPKHKLPKSFNHKLSDDELEDLDTADWDHDCKERERRQTLRYKKAVELAEEFDKKRKK